MAKKTVASIMEEEAIEHVPTTKELGDLMILVNQFQALDAEILTLTESLNEKKATQYNLSTITIPEKLTALNLSEIRTINGDKVVVKTGLKDYEKIEIISGISVEDELIKPVE